MNFSAPLKYVCYSVCLCLSTAVVCAVDEPSKICGLNEQADSLAGMIIEHPAQQREQLQCNQQLTSIAQQRAEQLATHSADPALTPNQVLIKGGFRVPNYYPVSGNQVEAVAKGFVLAERSMQYFEQSTKHHDHVLGIGEFFALQSQLGVGYYQDDDPTTQTQWVVLMAEPWQTPKIVFKQKFNMPFKIAKGCETDWKNGNDEFLKQKCRSMGRSKRAKAVETKLKCDANSCEKL